MRKVRDYGHFARFLAVCLGIACAARVSIASEADPAPSAAKATKAARDERADGLATVAEKSLLPEEAVWSETVNGLCARIFLKRSHVSNGTPILATYLVLRNVSDIANPMKLPWSNARLTFQVVDGAATEVPKWNGPYDGRVATPVDLVLPYGSELSFDISHHGMGIPGDKAALIDLGSSDNWIIESDRGEFYLKARIEIDKPKQDRDGSMRVWHGRLELPPAVIPLTPEARE